MSWTRDCVLVPTDFSERSWKAIDEALAIAGDPSQVHVMYVLSEEHPASPSIAWPVVDDRARIAKATEALNKLVDDRGAHGAHVHVVVGNPGVQVAKIAVEIGADLVVIASHGRTGLSHLLLGSVAERVARLSPCPVLILRE